MDRCSLCEVEKDLLRNCLVCKVKKDLARAAFYLWRLMCRCGEFVETQRCANGASVNSAVNTLVAVVGGRHVNDKTLRR